MLNAFFNHLTELDVSSNTALEWLSVGFNQLTELDISNNMTLRSLYVGNNQLTELDVSNNTALESLNVFNNQLTELDVSNNTALHVLGVGGNQLTELDVSHNTGLTWLDATFNQLTELDISHNTALTNLSVSNNQLTELDVSNHRGLTVLQVSDNQLTELDVSNNTALSQLYTDNNQLTGLDVSNNTAMRRLNVVSNNMTDPDDVIGWRGIPLELLPEGVPRSTDGFHFWPQSGSGELPPPSVTAVTAAPSTAYIPPGGTQQFTANVTATGGADTSVTWSVTGNNSAGTTISSNGLLTVAENETAVSLTVTAVSNFNPAIYGTAVVYVIPRTGTISITTGQAGRGGRVVLRLRLDGNPGFAHMMMRLSFSDRLTLVGCSLGNPYLTPVQTADLAQGFTAPALGGGGSLMEWSGRNSDITLNGTLLTLTFEVVGYAALGEFLPVQVYFEDGFGELEWPRNAAGEVLNFGKSGGGGGVQVFAGGGVWPWPPWPPNTPTPPTSAPAPQPPPGTPPVGTPTPQPVGTAPQSGSEAGGTLIGTSVTIYPVQIPAGQATLVGLRAVPAGGGNWNGGAFSLGTLPSGMQAALTGGFTAPASGNSPFFLTAMITPAANHPGGLVSIPLALANVGEYIFNLTVVSDSNTGNSDNGNGGGQDGGTGGSDDGPDGQNGGDNGGSGQNVGNGDNRSGGGQNGGGGGQNGGNGDNGGGGGGRTPFGDVPQTGVPGIGGLVLALGLSGAAFLASGAYVLYCKRKRGRND